jgi:hypothetical protein
MSTTLTILSLAYDTPLGLVMTTAERGVVAPMYHSADESWKALLRHAVFPVAVNLPKTIPLKEVSKGAEAYGKIAWWLDTGYMPPLGYTHGVILTTILPDGPQPD